jgi:hypothetical protein
MLKFILSCIILLGTQTERVSFLGVECVPEKGVIMTCLKLNYNDFIFDYRLSINDDQEFDPSGKIDTSVILLDKYISNKIRISANDNILNGKITGIVYTEGELKIDLLYSYNRKAKQFRVQNTILTDINKNQSNLLIFKYKDIERGVRLSARKTEHVFNVKQLSEI